MSKLYVYSFNLNIRATGVDGVTLNHHKQHHTYVAAETQKRAAELLGVRPDEMRTYGGMTHNRQINAMCLPEPDTLFVELSYGTYIRMADLDDPSKVFTIDMKDEDLYGRQLESAAYGQMRVARISGRADLFQVDYPQEHFIELVISTAHVTRRGGVDHTMADREVTKVWLSEVQWARMIASPNTEGVACTLRQYRDPLTGEFKTPLLPPEHVADADTFKDEVKRKASLALESMNEARTRLYEIMKGPLRKGDLQEVIELLEKANREGVANLPYVAESAAEKIDEAAENAKTEIGAFLDFAMTKLGERALGDRLAQALADGRDIRGIGQMIADNVLTVPALTDLTPGDD